LEIENHYSLTLALTLTIPGPFPLFGLMSKVYCLNHRKEEFQAFQSVSGFGLTKLFGKELGAN
jgi:hypothetical protein